MKNKKFYYAGTKTNPVPKNKIKMLCGRRGFLGVYFKRLLLHNVYVDLNVQRLDKHW